MSATVTRRPKWQYPPPPTPRIIHLPRRPRRKQKANPTSSAAPARPSSGDRKGKLEALFDQERAFSKTGSPIVLLECNEVRRERVVDGGGAAEEAEKWRFQAEMLRAECNLLRMEREIALKKLERTRSRMQRTLRSTVQTLITGRNKIIDGETFGLILEEEIQELAEKLEKLQRRSGGAKDSEGGRSCRNFDKQACHLQRKLEKFGSTMSKESCASEVREIGEASLSINTSFRVDESFVSTRKCNDVQLDVLRRKMEGLSKGMLLEKMEEEYGSLLSTANSSTASSASTSKRIEAPDMPCTSIRQHQHETMAQDGGACAGQCKMIVRRIVEQVRAETEQWSQMQEMLGQVREEMEELQASRDFWEERALDNDSQTRSLRSSAQEWKEKAITYETKANELEVKVSRLERELEGSRKEEKTNTTTREKKLMPVSRETPNETEKRVLICRLKENKHGNKNASKQKDAYNNDGRRKSFGGGGAMNPKRSPFRDIGNFSPMVRERSRGVSPLHFSIPSNNE